MSRSDSKWLMGGVAVIIAILLEGNKSADWVVVVWYMVAILNFITATIYSFID